MTRKQRRKAQKRRESILRRVKFVDPRAISNPDYKDATPVVFAWDLLRDQQEITIGSIPVEKFNSLNWNKADGESVHGLLPPNHKFVIPIFYRRKVTS